MVCRLRFLSALSLAAFAVLASLVAVAPVSAQVAGADLQESPAQPADPGQQRLAPEPPRVEPPRAEPPRAELARPTRRDAMVSRLIASLMPRQHISAEQLNDKISKRAFELFVKSLDPLKLYFFQSDIEEFGKYETSIDEMVGKGDLALAYAIFRRFITRVEERVDVALELLDQPFDFDVDETLVVDADDLGYATNPDEARDRWRRQIKYALLDLKDDGEDMDESIAKLKRRYQRRQRRWQQTDSDDLLEMYLSSVTMAYDPHSTYMAPSSLDDFKIAMSLNLDGIGAQLTEKDGMTTITRVIPGGAADLDGRLKPDDVIVSVSQGTDGTPVDVMEMPLSDVVDLIRGKAGTTVTLGIKPGGDGSVERLSIVRDRIELEESAARGEIIEHAVPGTSRILKIGYINLPSFYLDMDAARIDVNNYRSSTRDVRRILIDFQRQGIDGVVLDLARNGGGSLTEAINLTGLFIDQGPVVQVKNADGTVQQYADEEAGTSWDGPLVVVTSKFSASASEIFAGAIKDYKRGIVVGDPATHGKGTVQTLMDLAERLFLNKRENYGALKVTLQQFYLPDGESTQVRGVAADVVLPSVTSKMDVAESDLKYALEFDRVKAAPHVVYGQTPADLIGTLRQRSAQRVATDKEFNDLMRRIELYVAQKEQATVSLEESVFMERRRELDAQKEDEKEVIEQQLGSEEIYNDSFYNKEVMNISADYIDGLRKQNLARLR